jgi:hypothetical protein
LALSGCWKNLGLVIDSWILIFFGSKNRRFSVSEIMPKNNTGFLHLCFISYSFTASGFGSVVTGGLWVLVGEQFRCLSIGPEAAHHVGKGELQMARTGREGGREREREREKQREREGGSDGGRSGTQTLLL